MSRNFIETNGVKQTTKVHLDKVNEDFTDCFKHRTKATVTETTPVFVAGVADAPEIQSGEFHF